MPYNGSGTYSLPVAPFVNGAVISAADVNSDLSDIASALSNVLVRDGQAAMSGPLNMGSNGLTGVTTITTTGPVSFGSTLNLTGAATLASTLGVTGATTLAAALTGTTAAFSGVVTAANGTSGTRVVNFSQFAQSIAAIGYITLPGGLRLQWGNDTAAVGNQTTTWPIAFSAAPYFVGGIIKDVPLAGATIVLGVAAGPTATQAVFVTTNSATGALIAANYFWFAIGPS